MELDDPSSSLDVGMDEREEIGESAILLRRLVEGDDLVGGRRHLTFALMAVHQVATVDVDAIRPPFVDDAGDFLQDESPPAGARRRASGHVPVADDEDVARTSPGWVEVWIGGLDEAGGDVGQNPKATRPRHGEEPPVSLGVDRRILVAAKQPQ